MTDEPSGFEMFFAREYQAVVRTLFVMTGDRLAAEDIAQEAFARLYPRWTRVGRYERPEAWVRRVAINIAISSWRRRRLDFMAAHTPATTTDEHIDLHRAIVSLPRLQRAVLVLHYFEDRPLDECATLIGCASSTARVHLHKARKRLGDILNEEVPDAAG